jgi:uncharacterized protein YqeY
MTLIEKISADFMAAYKAKEMEKKDFLGVLKTEVTKESKTPEDSFVVSKIKTMIKNAAATDSLSESELAILEVYLPKQLSEEELTLLLNEEAKTQGYKLMADMGKLMSFLKNTHGGKYDGKMASTLVRSILK